MPKLRVLALSIGMAATAAMLSMPGDAGAQRRKAEKTPASRRPGDSALP